VKFDEIIERDKRREEGAWVKEGFRDLSGLALKVRGDGNPDHTKRLSDLYNAATPEEREASDFNTQLTIEAMLDAILLDWNIEDRPFTREAARVLLATDTFRQAVFHASRVVASVGIQSLEADVKN
jgi:hypothetical protein